MPKHTIEAQDAGILSEVSEAQNVGVNTYVYNVQYDELQRLMQLSLSGASQKRQRGNR